MKKLSLFSLMLVGLFLFSISAGATGNRKEFKDFEITPVEDIFLGKNVKCIWKLSYSSDEVPVTVVKHKIIDGAEYVVYSKYFEVSYVTTSDGFGVKNVRNSWSKVPGKISKAVLNQDEMKRQQIISVNKMSDEKALGLIASFLPDLVNDGYTHVLN